MAEKRTDHELGGASITGFDHGRTGRISHNYGRPPELLLSVPHHVSHKNPSLSHIASQ